MAPAAKRKKPGATEDQSPAAATKSRAKRQKTAPEPTNPIETPPQTPQPAPVKRGRKPAATKHEKVNGSHVKPIGLIDDEAEDTSTPDIASAADSDAEAPAVKPLASTAKRKVVIADDEDEDEGEDQDESESETDDDDVPLATQRRNGISTKVVDTNRNGLAESEKQTTSSLKAEKAASKRAKDSKAAVIGESTSNNLEVPRQAPSLPSMSPTVQSSSTHTIQPTTEPMTSHPMEQAKPKDKVKSKDREKRDKLYQYCLRTKPVGEIFSIKELEQSNIADDSDDLLSLCRSLVTHLLFTVMTLGRGVLYKTRSYDVAKKLASVSDNHILVYSLIENAGPAGVWMRPLELRSGLHTAIVRKAVRELVSAKVVQEIKSAETSKKTYISADVKPDEKHIGGGFMDEGKFDEGMINILTYVVTQYLQDKSWAKQDIRISDEPQQGPPAVTKQKSKTPGQKAAKPVAPIELTNDNEPAPAQPKPRNLYPPWTFRKQALVPQPPDYYIKYPSAIDVMVEINEKKVIKDIVLTLKDTEQLLSKMEFDGYIERMRDADGNLNMKEPRWRACRRTWKLSLKAESSDHFGPLEPDERGWLPGNGLSQVPCARCPVRIKCKVGGVVSPETCKYLDEWLAF